MTRETGRTFRYQGHRLGPDILWKPYHNKVQEYKPHTYDGPVQPYDRVHEYRKVHEYTRIHEHRYSEYTSSFRPKYHEYKLTLQKKPLRYVHPPRPPKLARKSLRKRQGNLFLCYTQPMGPDIRVKEHKYTEYQRSEYQPTYSEYNASTGQYMDNKWTEYNGNVEYVLTPYNHYPLRWGRNEKQNVDNNSNDSKEPTQTSLSTVKPIVYVEKPAAGDEQDVINEEPKIAETGFYWDPTIENTPFVEEEDDFYVAPLVITDQVATPLPIKDRTETTQDEYPESPPQKETPESYGNDEHDTVVPVVAAATTGGHTGPDEPEVKSQETTKHNTDPDSNFTDNEPLVAPVVMAAAAASPNDDVVPVQDTAPDVPVEEAGRWSSLTTHGAGNAEGNLTPVEAAVAGAILIDTQGRKQEQPSDTEIADAPPVNEVPTTGSEVAEPVTAAAPVESVPVVAAAPAATVPVVATAAVVAESAPSDSSTVAADPSTRLPPEVVANIEAYSNAHAAEVFIK